MKKHRQITTILCLLSLVLFGYFSTIYSQQTPEYQAWQDAQDALTAADTQMEPLKLEHNGYITERDTIVADAPSEILGLLAQSAIPIIGNMLAQYLTGQEIARLIELDTRIENREETVFRGYLWRFLSNHYP